MAQTVLDLKLWENLNSSLTFNHVSISPVSWLLGFLSLVLVVIINEIVKLHEIRYAGRWGERAGASCHPGLKLQKNDAQGTGWGKKEKMTALHKSPGCCVQAHVPPLREEAHRRKEGQGRAVAVFGSRKGHQNFLISNQ